MSDGDRPFRIRPGSIRQTRIRRPKSFVSQVMRAARTAGHVSQRAGMANRTSGRGRSTFGRGRIAFARERLFSAKRRVVIKARIVRHKGAAFRSAPLSAHLSYLKRDGVTRHGADAAFFDADNDRLDGKAFVERCDDDRHHFRFIVSPEDALEMTDLRGFARDLAGQMETDLNTKLDWVAVDHWNTDNPHVHLLVRGVDENGADLVIARDYISHGLRSRAEELVAIELGPKPEHDIRNAIEREVTAERWTRLDNEIRFAADETGIVDLRLDPAKKATGDMRRLMIGRLKHLERMGLAQAAGSGVWMTRLEAEPTLRALGDRGDIIKTMHRAFAGQGEERPIADYSIANDTSPEPVVGRLVDRGLHDELTGKAYAIIDGTDGRAHHVRFGGLEAFAHAPPPGGIVEVRKLGGDAERPTLWLANRSDIDLPSQIAALGATWLDHRLVEREPMPLAMGGFGKQVRDAMEARVDHLESEGLVRRQAQRVVFQRNLLRTLRQRELDTAAEKLSSEMGATYRNTATGDSINGIYGRRLTLSSGRFAVVEKVNSDGGLGFRLVPWSPPLEKRLNQHVSGVMRDGGGVDWSFTRKRGLGR